MKEYWFVPAKWTYYNIGASIKENNGLADWGMEGLRLKVGDIVFIYLTKPYMCIKYKMEVIAQGIQKKIDHLLAMDADFYIVPEMADPKLLKIPDMYEAKWIGEYQKKGLGVIWKRYLNVMDVPSCDSGSYINHLKGYFVGYGSIFYGLFRIFE